MTRDTILKYRISLLVLFCKPSALGREGAFSILERERETERERERERERESDMACHVPAFSYTRVPSKVVVFLFPDKCRRNS
jgi:hypothetical protein